MKEKDWEVLVNDLKTLKGEIEHITRRIGVAKEWRTRITKRIPEIIEVLRRYPNNRTARERLVNRLERERQFVDMVRNGTKDGISILRATLKKLKKVETSKKYHVGMFRRAKISPETEQELLRLTQEKNMILQDLQFVIDAMRFAQGKIKVIENRIKLGEALESKGYAGEHLDEFLQTRVEEENINRELALVLQGKSEKVKGELSSLWYKFKAQRNSGLITAGTMGGIVSYVHLAESGASMPDEFIMGLFTAIIAASLGLMVAISKDTIKREKLRRNG